MIIMNYNKHEPLHYFCGNIRDENKFGVEFAKNLLLGYIVEENRLLLELGVPENKIKENIGKLKPYLKEENWNKANEHLFGKKK